MDSAFKGCEFRFETESREISLWTERDCELSDRMRGSSAEHDHPIGKQYSLVQIVSDKQDGLAGSADLFQQLGVHL
jgi:hypothetical protein